MGLTQAIVCAALVASAAGYTPSALRSPQRAASRSAAVTMGAPAIIATKAQIVTEVQETLDNTMLMFCVRSEGVKVNQMNDIRQKLPEGTVVRCLKNTLVKRAIADYEQFPESEDLLQYSNYWFFVPEANVRETVELWDKFVADAKLDDNKIVGGMFEGQVLDPAGIEAVTKLPTKQELMGQTAACLKALPTKLARSLKAADAERLARVIKEAQGQKLGRAVAAMKEKLPEA